MDRDPAHDPARLWLAAVAGLVIGTLGGLIGLGGAEFRLPLLIGVFGFAALQAVILNKAMSLVVVVTAIPARLAAVPAADLAPQWPVVINLLAGTLVGAYLGAGWAMRLRSATLYRVLAGLLVGIAVVLALSHLGELQPLGLPAAVQVPAGVVVGIGIGVVAAVMGVAGGELLIPAMVLIFGIDIKTAGSLSLLVSVPTMLVSFARYRADDSFAVVRREVRFAVAMASGSVVGALVGGALLAVVSAGVIVPLLVALLAWSATTLWRHDA